MESGHTRADARTGRSHLRLRSSGIGTVAATSIAALLSECSTEPTGAELAAAEQPVIELTPVTYDTVRLGTGDQYYHHRGYTVMSLEPGYDGWLWIRTANDPGASPLHVYYRALGCDASVVLGGNMAQGAAGAQSMYVVMVLPEAELRPTAVLMTPSRMTLTLGETVQFAAAVVDQVGQPAGATGSFQWSASGGTIDAQGRFTAGGTVGKYEVTARVPDSGLAGTATVEVTGASAGKIAGVSWTCSQLITGARGSDLWPTTWSDDGHQYTAWGDGSGFQDSSRFSYGITRLAGPPENFTATDLGEFSPGDGGGKIAGMISLDGTLYMWRNDQSGSPSTHTLLKSTDKGSSVVETSVRFPRPGVPKMVVEPIINFGQDNADAIDGYVYAVAGDWGEPRPTYLVRVPATQIENSAAYEVFSGSAQSPAWSTDMADRQPIFDDAAAASKNGSLKAVIVYIPPLRQFILTVPFADDVGKWTLQSGPNPWGPWTEVARYTDWCGAGGAISEILFFHIAPAWVSNDGIHFWVVFSATGEWDRFNAVKGTFQLQ